MTKKPCPGCGRVDRYRKANEVCNVCRRDLDTWKKHLETLDQQDATTQPVKLSEVDYAWPGFYNGAHGHGFETFDTHRDGLQKSLHQLAYRLAKVIYPKHHGPDGACLKAEPLFQVPGRDYPTSQGMPGWFNTIALFAKTDVDLFRALYDHIAQFAELCYLSGLKSGQNILIGLANGTLDLKELEETHERLSKATQQANARNRHRRETGKK
jgi:hypothetical protein